MDFALIASQNKINLVNEAYRLNSNFKDISAYWNH